MMGVFRVSIPGPLSEKLFARTTAWSGSASCCSACASCGASWAARSAAAAWGRRCWGGTSTWGTRRRGWRVSLSLSLSLPPSLPLSLSLSFFNKGVPFGGCFGWSWDFGGFLFLSLFWCGVLCYRPSLPRCHVTFEGTRSLQRKLSFRALSWRCCCAVLCPFFGLWHVGSCGFNMAVVGTHFTWLLLWNPTHLTANLCLNVCSPSNVNQVKTGCFQFPGPKRCSLPQSPVVHCQSGDSAVQAFGFPAFDGTSSSTVDGRCPAPPKKPWEWWCPCKYRQTMVPHCFLGGANGFCPSTVAQIGTPSWVWIHQLKNPWDLIFSRFPALTAPPAVLSRHFRDQQRPICEKMRLSRWLPGLERHLGLDQLSGQDSHSFDILFWPPVRKWVVIGFLFFNGRSFLKSRIRFPRVLGGFVERFGSPERMGEETHWYHFGVGEFTTHFRLPFLAVGLGCSVGLRFRCWPMAVSTFQRPESLPVVFG